MRSFIVLRATALSAFLPLMSLAVAQTAKDPAKPALAPVEVIAGAPAKDWVAIPASDLIVMDLAPDMKGQQRRVVIQLLPPPFSQGWVSNIRQLAAARWWDGTSINRVQDNYVVQWGDPEGENPSKAKPLPAGLRVVPQSEYTISTTTAYRLAVTPKTDSYAPRTGFFAGWPVAQISSGRVSAWPLHCYGMVGVGRSDPPDTGTGAELYTVIGHAPRQLDRNIALVGRIIDGMTHLSSLPRGKGEIGFYDPAQGDERVPILSIRLGSAVADLPAYQYLGTDTQSFARYADARANRRDPFYIQPAGGADICNIPVPVRRAQ